jgi:hypothetical protein
MAEECDILSYGLLLYMAFYGFYWIRLITRSSDEEGPLPARAPQVVQALSPDRCL